PMEAPTKWVRILYSFGVVDPKDVAFMMGNINIVGEHLANQLLHKVGRAATDPKLKTVLGFIGKDESRHVAAGRRFFPEVYGDFKRHRHQIMAKNLATFLVLSIAALDLIVPIKTLEIDMVAVMDAMYHHYEEVTGGLPAFPDHVVTDAAFELLRRGT